MTPWSPHSPRLEVRSVTDSDLPVDPVFALHRGGKIEMRSTARVRDAEGLALAYTPGVARVCEAIAADPRFLELHRKKSGFLWGLMVFSVLFYFLLPIGAAYFPHLFSIKVWGPVNVGLLFALSEFIVAWGIAFIYSRRANTVFDPMAADIVKDIEKRYGVKK